MSSRTILEISGLRVQRGETLILSEISWKVAQGQHWVILGANGSGKTSLLSALTGYLTPTNGDILLLGRHYGRFDWREFWKQIGLVSSAVWQMIDNEQTALETVLSGKHAIINLYGRVDAQDRARGSRLLKSIECEHLAKRRWLVLSQGERQRILIGRALMAQPRLLILDEPCAGLDPAAREHFLQFIDRLGRNAASPALILVTHHLEEIMPVFSRVMVLCHGRVLASGKVRNILTDAVLSKAFNAKMHVRKRGARFESVVAHKRRVVL